jgi:hypothetical protein
VHPKHKEQADFERAALLAFMLPIKERELWKVPCQVAVGITHDDMEAI